MQSLYYVELSGFKLMMSSILCELTESPSFSRSLTISSMKTRRTCVVSRRAWGPGPEQDICLEERKTNAMIILCRLSGQALLLHSHLNTTVCQVRITILLYSESKASSFFNATLEYSNI